MSDRSNIRSLKNYGIHGALALLIGVGIGSVVYMIASVLLVTLDFISIPYIIDPTTLLLSSIFYTVVFLIFGGYIGYIFESQKGFSRLVITGAIAGAICAIAGVICAIARGGLSGLNEPYVEPAIFMSIMGIAGALLAIGMHYSNRIVYTSKELPQYFKITRIIGVGLVVVLLSLSSFVFVAFHDHASTSTSVTIISDSDNITLYIPVLMDNNGNVLEMYESLTITGNATVAVIDTKYGPALKINGNSKEIKIETIQKHRILQVGETIEKFIEEFSISMSNSSLYDNATHPLTVDVWIYSDNEIKDCNIRYEIDNGYGTDLLMSKYNLELRPKWQKVRLSGGIRYYD